MLREATFRAVRIVGGLLPLPLLAAVLWPIAIVRAVADLALRPARHPVRTLPPPSRRGRNWSAGVRQRTTAWLNTTSLLWADQFSALRWSSRFELVALESLRALGDRPVIVITLHFGGIFALPTLLRSAGMPTASVVADGLWPIRWWRQRRAELTCIGDLPLHFRSGDALAIARFLVPGNFLVVAGDYPHGGRASTTFESVGFELSTPAFRLARLTRAVVVPALVRADGVWHYTVHVGRPVPDEVIRQNDHQAAVDHIAAELLPVAAQRPEQAMPLLIAAFDRARPVVAGSAP